MSRSALARSGRFKIKEKKKEKEKKREVKHWQRNKSWINVKQGFGLIPKVSCQVVNEEHSILFFYLSFY